MANNLLTGAQNAADGTFLYGRAGKQGDTMVSQLHGGMYEQAYRGSLFSASNQAAVTTTAALATTFTGLAIANPATSGVNLVIRQFQCAQFAVGAAGAIGVMVGAGAAAGSLIARNCKVGGAISPATTASAGATIATPVLERIVGSVGSAATSAYGLSASICYDFHGSLIIPPGYYAASFTSAITTTALLFGFVWEEVPV